MKRAAGLFLGLAYYRSIRDRQVNTDARTAGPYLDVARTSMSPEKILDGMRFPTRPESLKSVGVRRR